jgi:hypothetical protein
MALPQPAPEPEASFRRDDAAQADLVAALERLRSASIEAGRALLRIERSGHHRATGCASIGEYGERMGLSARDARQFLAMARAMESSPALEERFRAGLVSAQAAALMDRVLREPGFVRAGDNWLGWAQEESAKELHRRIERRREEERLDPDPPVERTFFVSTAAAEGFDRARTIASRKARRSLSEAETFEVVVADYLDRHDPLRRREGRRRMPDTSSVPDRRTLPAEVARETARRTRDKCAVPFCDHRGFLHYAHVVPHARCGSREARNIVRLCTQHHWMLDHGLLLMRGTAAAPRFYAPDGTPLARRAADESRIDPAKPP